MTECPTCGKERERLGLHFTQGPCGHPKLSPYKRDLLRGMLMGDGTAEKQSGNRYARFSVDMVSREFLEWLDGQLEWLSTGVTEIPRDYDSVRQQQYRLRTRTHPFLDTLRTWYDSGKKRWPDDLELTPTITKMWYVCDGTFNTYNSSSNAVFYAVNEEDRPEYVTGLFEDVGFNASYYGNGQFTLDVQSSQNVLDWMGDAPPDFEYKWVDYEVQYIKGGKWTDEGWMRKKYCDEGLTGPEIADEINVSPTTISVWLRRHGIETGGRGPN